MNLNEAQEAAVESENPAILVLAGAGTGKTRVIIRRIEKIIEKGGYANKIVATTFTNKASREMKERLIKNIGMKSQAITCGTFHRISMNLLRLYGHHIGLPENFQILNEDDQSKLIKRLCKELGSDSRNPRNIAELISTHKESEKKITKDPFFTKLFNAYDEELRRTAFLDYSDLIQHTIFLFENKPEIRKSIADHILVDEYQDVNESQYKWIKLISEGKNLFCVGDEDQSIYSFRGANIKYIQKFEEDFPNAHIIKLEENYRSTSEILTGAGNIIRKNRRKFEKNLKASTNEKGIIRITKTLNEYEEANLVARKIAEWMRQKDDLKIGVLVRTNAQIAYIEQALVQAKINYSISSGKKFYLKKEIQDILAYLRVILYPHDYFAFSRIINTPKRGIGETRLATLLTAMKSLNCLPEEALASLLPQLPKITSEKIKILLLQLNNWRDCKDILKPDALVEKIMEDINYKKEEDLKDKQKETLNNLIGQLKETKNIEEFLENIQFSGQEEENNIEIMTIHASKGLEFDIVIAPGWEENVFPSPLSKTHEELEEERRLAYVTITRAKRGIDITYASTRRINGKFSVQIPSRFIFDIY